MWNHWKKWALLTKKYPLGSLTKATDLVTQMLGFTEDFAVIDHEIVDKCAYIFLDVRGYKFRQSVSI